MAMLNIDKLDYDKIYEAYKMAPNSNKHALLREADEKFGLDFDPEEVLEMIVDEVNSKLSEGDELLAVTQSLHLKWCEIAEKLHKNGFGNYAKLMVPAIEECGYETWGLER